jgi:hypothetical protein
MLDELRCYLIHVLRYHLKFRRRRLHRDMKMLDRTPDYIPGFSGEFGRKSVVQGTARQFEQSIINLLCLESMTSPFCRNLL